jgi:RimJ/RimL family protein N-acetyltransferase
MDDHSIETRRLRLRLMEEDDLHDLWEIFKDPKVVASFEEEPFSLQQMEGWLGRNLEHQDSHGYGLFTVILKSEGVLIGDCGLEHMQFGGEQVTELGYDFRSDYWNQGYATEAAAAVRDFAFHVLGLPFLVSLIRVGNQASRRVAQKIGMQFESEIKKHSISYWKYSVRNSRNLN